MATLGKSTVSMQPLLRLSHHYWVSVLTCKKACFMRDTAFPRESLRTPRYPSTNARREIRMHTHAHIAEQIHHYGGELAECDYKSPISW